MRAYVEVVDLQKRDDRVIELELFSFTPRLRIRSFRRGPSPA